MYLDKFFKNDGGLNGQKLRFDQKTLTFLREELLNRKIVDVDQRSNAEKFFLVYYNTTPGKCRQCGIETSFHNIKNGYRDFCSFKCRSNNNETKLKTKETNLKIRGVENPSKSQDVINKIYNKNGMNPAQTESSRDKIKKKINEVYSDEERKNEILRKRNSTILKRYGDFDNFIDQRNKLIKQRHGADFFKKTTEKAKESFEEKHGIDNPFKLSYFQEKATSRIYEIYGVENASYIPGVTEKRINTNLKKYNRKWHNQSHISKPSLEIINDNESFLSLSEHCNYNPYSIAEYLGISHSHLLKIIKDHNIVGKNNKSFLEKAFYDFLTSLIPKTSIIKNTRKIIPPQEIDFYLPEYQTGFEINGIYWHSEANGVDKNYHVNKSQKAYEKGVKLIHIFEDEIFYKWDVLKSRINSVLGQSSLTVNARDCKIEKVDKKVAKDFFEDNHLQGNSVFTEAWGLRKNQDLVQVISFSKNRFKNDDTWEAVRVASKKDTQVRGGISKIIKNFKKEKGNVQIVTFIDKSWVPHQDLFSMPGFRYEYETKPGYSYVINKTRKSRQKYQKHKLSMKLDYFDQDLSEKQNMILNGYWRIWDCGNLKYVI